MRLGMAIVKFLTVFPIELLLDDNFKVLPINCDPVVKQLSCDSTRIIKFRIYGWKESVKANFNFVDKVAFSILTSFLFFLTIKPRHGLGHELKKKRRSWNCFLLELSNQSPSVPVNFCNWLFQCKTHYKIFPILQLSHNHVS